MGRLVGGPVGLALSDWEEFIQQAAGKTIPAIFAEKGEPWFRALESRLLAELCAGPRQVIATGGGAVVAEGNRKLLKSSGFVVFLDRDIRDIDLRVGNRERPLLRTHTLAQLAAQRRSWYLDCADAAVGDGTAEQLAEQIAELWRKL